MKGSLSLLVIAIIVSTTAPSAQAAPSGKEVKTPGSGRNESAVVEPEPHDAAACTCRGVVKFSIGDLAGANADYCLAIALDPKFAPAWNDRGNVKTAMGDLAGAIADYTQAIELDPDDAPAYHNRSNARAATGDTQGAGADYARAVELDRKFAPPASII